ncbi:MAG: transposase [Fimbriimonadaceae bacterium]
MDHSLPDRKHPIHLPILERGNRSNIVFVTVCSKDRKPIFARSDVHDLLVSTWISAETWAVGRYILLPDHIHLFCSPADIDVSLQKWIQYWKSRASTFWPRKHEHPIWERHFWDRQLRSGESYDDKWDYVRNNAVRHGFATSAEEWPFCGELNQLGWLD